VTSPNEPGYPGVGDSPNGNGSLDRGGADRPASGPAAGRTSGAGDAPPWQRGTARKPQAAHRPPAEAPAQHEARPPGADARLARYITGAAAPGTGSSGHAKMPAQEPESAPVRHDGPRTEAYASELPDLSGPGPRSWQRKMAPDRGPDGSSASGPIRSAGTEAGVQVFRRSRGPVRACMQIRRIDPWSTLKVSLVLSVALFFVWMIAVAFLYLVLGGMGVWSKLNSNVGDLLNNTSGSGELVSSGTIFGGATLIGLVNIVLLTATATIGAFVYNLTTDLIGGIEVTLADRD
jgi:hypothetical protein